MNEPDPKKAFLVLAKPITLSRDSLNARLNNYGGKAVHSTPKAGA
jgi:hypothetical protein